MGHDKTGTVVVCGVHHDVTIAIDASGIPHITATDAADAFFGQGYAAAQARLFQMEMWLRRGTGRLSEVFGPTFVQQDEAARLFMYRGDMQDAWSAYGDADIRTAVESFVAGINAYIAFAGEHPAQLPEEFTALDLQPSHWDATELMRVRSHARTENLGKELHRALLIRDFGSAVEKLVYPHEDQPNDITLDPTIPWDSLDDEVLQLWELSKRDVQLPAGLQVGTVCPRPHESAHPLGQWHDDADLGGSNNWVIGPGLTANGHPILAHDPHRRMSIPALRMACHLTCPEFDVIGAGEPIMPGVSVGHNRHVAFSLTIHPSDDEDLFISPLNPDNSEQYRYQGCWRDITHVDETIHVKGASDSKVRLSYTHYGPVTRIDVQAGYVASVRSTSLEPGGVAYLSCLNYLGARSADEYRQGLSHWVLPVTNHVFADTDGYMQWQVAGLIPQRNNANGAVPTLGDGSHDWLGFSPFAHNAHRDIGPNEFFTTSNEYNLHSDRPRRAHDEGMDWPTPDRHLRLTELLSSRRNWDIESTKRVQSDVLDIRAREICRTLNDMVDDIPKPIDPKKPHYGNAMKAWRRLSTWDGTMDAACMEPLLFEVWSQRHLCPKLLGRYLLSILPESQCDAAFRRITELSNGHYDPRTLSSLFHDLTASPDCIGIILDTLQEAWQELCRAYGPNEHAWAWGRFHISSLSHLLDGHTQSSWPGLPARGLPGDFSTVCLGAYDQHGVHSVGPGWRMIFDVGDWDDDVQVLMPGQSGDPRSRHYRDQADAWYQGRYTPMHFSTDTSSASEWERITLVASPPLPRTDMHTI